MIEIADNPDIEANDYILARNMAETLNRHYPGHLWAVTCEGDKGIATVRNLRLSGRWGFILKLREMDKNMRCVMRAGGELLERYRLARRAFNQDHYEALPTDFAGQLKADQ
jgi:hypothetical protein